MRGLRRIICMALALIMIVFIAGCDGKKVVTEDGRTNNDLKAEYSEAQKLIDEGKYEEAIIALDGIPDTYNKYSDVVAARTKAVDIYIEDVIEQVDSLSTENKDIEALDLIEKSKTIVGDNPLIASREDGIKVRLENSSAEPLIDQGEEPEDEQETQQAEADDNTLEAFLERDSSLSQEIQMIASANGLEISVDDNIMTFTYQYSEIFSKEMQESAAQLLDQALSEQDNTFTSLAEDFKSTTGIADIIVRVEYIDGEGTILWSKEYKAK